LTIILNLRSLGGCSGTSSKGTGSFKDEVKGKDEAQTNPTPSPELPAPYIVEQKSQIPALTISLLEVNELYADFHTKAVIRRFNGFWPKLNAIHHWIFITWTSNRDSHLFSVGFLIFRFDTVKDKEYALNERPWFWGNACLFMIP